MTIAARIVLEVNIPAIDLKRATKKLSSVSAKTVQIDGDSGTLSAMDEDLGISTSIFQTSGKVSVDLNLFKSTVSKLTKDVKLEQSGNSLTISSAKFKSTIPISSDWPTFPTSTEKGFTLSSEKLNNLLSFTSIVTTEKNNFDHTGSILIRTSGENIEAIATDNHRIAFTDYPLSINIPQTIIPSKAVKALKDFTGDITISESNNCIFFKSEDTTVFARKTNVKFPNIDAVVPKSYSLEVKFDVGLFRECIDRVMPTVDPEVTPKVVLEFGESLKLSTGNSLIGQSEDYLDIEHLSPVKKLTIAANIKYIAEFLGAVSGCGIIRLDASKPFMMEAGNRRLLTAGLKV